MTYDRYYGDEKVKTEVEKTITNNFIVTKNGIVNALISVIAIISTLDAANKVYVGSVFTNIVLCPVSFV